MVDRAPTKPNRYAVYDENHNFIRYEYHERADEPTQVGDALNKANLLPDAVATALGLTGNPQVKDAMLALQSLANTKAKIVTGSYTGTGTYGSSNKCSAAIGFAPKLFVVVSETYGTGFTRGTSSAHSFTGFGIFVNPVTKYYASNTSGSSANGTIIWESTIQWYNSNAETQFNTAGEVFRYFAIG